MDLLHENVGIGERLLGDDLRHFVLLTREPPVDFLAMEFDLFEFDLDLLQLNPARLNERADLRPAFAQVQQFAFDVRRTVRRAERVRRRRVIDDDDHVLQRLGDLLLSNELVLQLAELTVLTFDTE